MPHVVLLGDSIFDNDRYVPGGPAVIEHLKRLLPAGWRATLLARDGAGVEEMPRQLEVLPADATHFVLSVGGNNALDHAPVLLSESAASYAEVLTHLGTLHEQFRLGYRDLLRVLCRPGRAVAVCTIYDAIPGLELAERGGLCVFNDAILHEAFAARVPVLDLRRVCTDHSDYAATSPIEPSASGGGKIARLVAQVVTGHDFTAAGSRVFP